MNISIVDFTTGPLFIHHSTVVHCTIQPLLFSAPVNHCSLHHSTVVHCTSQPLLFSAPVNHCCSVHQSTIVVQCTSQPLLFSAPVNHCSLHHSTIVVQCTTSFSLTDVIDIVTDSLSGSDYKLPEDPHYYQSVKTGRGPLEEDWKQNPPNGVIMCSYKLIKVLGCFTILLMLAP